MESSIIGITTREKAIIIVNNMDISLRIALGHTLEATTKKKLSQSTCFIYLKTDHISKHFPTRSNAFNCEFDKGQGKVDVEHIRDEMNKI